MSWIRLDPQELGAAGAALRDASLALTDVSARLRSACCSPGLGQHASPLMVEGEALSARVLSITESYLRMAIDVIQRAIAAVRDAELVTVVGDVGSVSSAVIGGSTVGGTTTGWTSSIPAPTIGTIGGTGPAILTIAGTSSSGGSIPGMTTTSVGGSWSSTKTDTSFPPSVVLLAHELTVGANSPRALPRGGISGNDFMLNISLAQLNTREMTRMATITPLVNANNMGIAPSQSEVGAYASANNLSFTPDRGQRR